LNKHLKILTASDETNLQREALFASLQLPSPVHSFVFCNHHFYLKRDDLIDSDFSGNKARKFYYYLFHQFPEIKTLRSYGSAQSNAMYSLSVLAKMRGWEFEYYVDHVTEYLKNNPHGNYQKALENGMHLFVDQKFPSIKQNEVLTIEEGGRQAESMFGIMLLAQEIVAWKNEKNLEKLCIFLPSGTGTTALYLQKYLSVYQKKPTIFVYTTPCVGDVEYLKKQFDLLEPDERYHPVILISSKKYHFGKLYKEHYEMWLKLSHDTDVIFDLLYDPIGWRVVLENISLFEASTLYLHQGGVLGNVSMLLRYRRKFPHLEKEFF